MKRLLFFLMFLTSFGVYSDITNIADCNAFFSHKPKNYDVEMALETVMQCQRDVEENGIYYTNDKKNSENLQPAQPARQIGAQSGPYAEPQNGGPFFKAPNNPTNVNKTQSAACNWIGREIVELKRDIEGESYLFRHELECDYRKVLLDQNLYIRKESEKIQEQREYEKAKQQKLKGIYNVDSTEGCLDCDWPPKTACGWSGAKKLCNAVEIKGTQYLFSYELTCFEPGRMFRSTDFDAEIPSDKANINKDCL